MSNGLQKSAERSRREWEDTLLHGRTGIFLVINAFAVQKIGLELAIAIAAADCLWILASFQSWLVIGNLVKKCPSEGAQPIVDTTLGTGAIHHVFRPTTLVALWIPILTYFAWLTYIALLTRSCTTWVVVIVAMVLPFMLLLFLEVIKGK